MRYISLIMITKIKSYLKQFFLLAHAIGMMDLPVQCFSVVELHKAHVDSFDEA